MNIFACIKQVPDTEASISIREGKSINEANIKWIINPYDEFALEEALKLKEKNPGSTVTAVTLGPDRVESALRTALAMGVDKAVHILNDETLDDLATGAALAGALRKLGADGVIFMGKQAIDNDSYQVHLHVAEDLGIGAATNVTAFDFQDGKVSVEREIDEGAKEIIEMNLPCIVAATKGLNNPRYASVMGIMKAKRIEIQKLSLSDCGLAEVKNQVKVEKYSIPPEKPQGKVVAGEPVEAVKELVRLLKEEAKVL